MRKKDALGKLICIAEGIFEGFLVLFCFLILSELRQKGDSVIRSVPLFRCLNTVGIVIITR